MMLLLVSAPLLASPTSATFEPCKQVASKYLADCLKPMHTANDESCWSNARSAYEACISSIVNKHSASEQRNRREAEERRRLKSELNPDRSSLAGCYIELRHDLNLMLEDLSDDANGTLFPRPIDPVLPIKEFELHADGRFSVTWHPFESYVDYWGTYNTNGHDIAFKVTKGNFVPARRDLEGAFEVLPERQLQLTGVFLGDPQRDQELMTHANPIYGTYTFKRSGRVCSKAAGNHR
ncbi:MAG: hypothetical protein EVA65_10125 [Oceanococcus sp.]|nr:MAG: hypothetical protein EVA65_10125 [Oceanococcus sp.]